MKKLNVFLLCMLLCSAIACVKDFPHREVASIEIESNYVSIDEARDRVKDLLLQIDNPTRGASQRYIVEEYRLGSLNTKTSLDEEDSPLVYIFNFNDNNGFAIASGDNRMPPVFCITDQGRLTDSVAIPESAALLLSLIEDEYKSVVRGAKEYDSFVTEIDSLPILPGPQIGGDDDDDGDDDYISPTYVLYGQWVDSPVTGQKIQSRWGQGYPFNEKCPTEDGEHDLVGCVAVAVGQVMYYWKQNTTYNGHTYDWTLMSSLKDSLSIVRSPNKEYVQNLLSDLGREENLDMDYGLEASGADCDNIARTFENFGYSSGGTSNEYDVDIVRSEIDLDCPVTVCGYAYKKITKVLGVTVLTRHEEGHEWVIDQYKTQTRTADTYNTKTGNLISSGTQERTLVHCNFGWRGSWDGFYLSGIFNTNNGEGRISTRSDDKETDVSGYFKYLLTVHHGIRP